MDIFSLQFAAQALPFFLFFIGFTPLIIFNYKKLKLRNLFHFAIILLPIGLALAVIEGFVADGGMMHLISLFNNHNNNNSTLIYGNNYHGVIHDDQAIVRDLGFMITEPIYEYVRKDIVLIDLLGLINSLLLFPVVIFGQFYIGIFEDQIGLIYGWAIIQSGRVLTGLLTLLPYPHGASSIISNFDFPNMYSGSIYFYSGHIGQYSLLSRYLYQHGYRRSLIIGVILEGILSVALMLICRGHYSIDLLIGITGGYLVAGNVDNITKWAKDFYSTHVEKVNTRNTKNKVKKTS